MASSISSLLGAAGIGGAIGKAIVSLELETTKYRAELAAAEGETKAATGSMAGSVSKYAGLAKIGFAAVGVAAVAGVVVAVKAASDLNEQINKSKEVFEKSADSILEFGKTTAESMGISETAALSAAGSFGQLFQAAGITVRTSAEMSKAFVQLAADLASFNNIDPNEALQKLESGLAGMARPLRSVGVFLSEARVEAEAYSSGIAKTGETLTDAQKVQARYNIILQDTTKAQGDFQRTVGESLPNQLRVMKAELEDTAAELGEHLIPLMLDLAKIARDLVPVLAAVADGIILAFKPETYTSIPIIGEAFKALGVGIEAVGEAAQTSNDEIRRNGLPLLSEMQAKADLAAAGFDRLGLSLPELARMTDKVFHQAGESVAEFADMTGADLEKWSDDTKESFRSYVINLDKVNDATDFTRKDLRDSFQAMLEHARDLNQAMKTLSKEHWINDDFVKFLAEQPDKLILFANSSETQQKKMQEQWKTSGDILKNQVNDRLDQMTGILDNLDNKSTDHTIKIHYEYVGFDPSKPGMGAQPGTGGSG